MCGTESNCVLSGVWVFTPRHMHMSTLSRTSVQTVPFLRIKICIDPRRSNVSTESARSTLDFIGFQFEFERKKMQTFKDKHGHMTTPQQKSPSNAICQPSQHAGHRSHSKIWPDDSYTFGFCTTVRETSGTFWRNQQNAWRFLGANVPCQVIPTSCRRSLWLRSFGSGGWRLPKPRVQSKEIQ